MPCPSVSWPRGDGSKSSSFCLNLMLESFNITLPIPTKYLIIHGNERKFFCYKHRHQNIVHIETWNQLPKKYMSILGRRLIWKLRLRNTVLKASFVLKKNCFCKSLCERPKYFPPGAQRASQVCRIPITISSALKLFNLLFTHLKSDHEKIEVCQLSR